MQASVLTEDLDQICQMWMAQFWLKYIRANKLLSKDVCLYQNCWAYAVPIDSLRSKQDILCNIYVFQ